MHPNLQLALADVRLEELRAEATAFRRPRGGRPRSLVRRRPRGLHLPLAPRGTALQPLRQVRDSVV